MVSFFFFALGVWLGYWLRGTKIVTWVSKQIKKVEEE